MRVIVFAPHYAEYATRMARALSERAEVLLIVQRRDVRQHLEPAWFKTQTSGFEVLEFDASNRLYRAAWMAAVIARCRMFRPDIVHLQEGEDPITARLAHYMSRRSKIVVTVHDPKPHSGSDADFMVRSGQRFADQVRAQAHMFHLHGEACILQFGSQAAGRLLVSTMHGLIHVPNADELRPPEPGRILMFGRMEAYKGLDVLLTAADILAQDRNPCKIVLAGRGADLDDRKRQRAGGLANVEILDRFLRPAEVVEQFQRAAMVVLPYLDATQSGVAAAAIANARPMIASAVGGLVDVVRDGYEGLLVRPGDAPALAASLSRVARDPTLYAKLAGGSASAQTRLDWRAIASILYQAYTDLLAGDFRGSHGGLVAEDVDLR